MKPIKIDELNHLQIVKESNIELCGNEIIKVSETGIKIIHNGKDYAVVVRPTEQEGFVEVINFAEIKDLNGSTFSEFIDSFRDACCIFYYNVL